MLTLEQLFPTKLFETDPEQVQTILAQLPNGRITYVFLNKNDRPNMILRTDDGIRTTYWMTRYDIDTQGRMVSCDEVTAIACTPTPVQKEFGLRCHHATLSSIEWYPGWNKLRTAIDFQVKQKATHQAIMCNIATWAQIQSCKKALKGKILQGPVPYMLSQVKDNYMGGIYGCAGAKFRKVAIAAHNALMRFVVWMKRFTDSIWKQVPIEICRMIARMCRGWA